MEPLSGAEIFELGVQIEKNGVDFYATLAEKSVSQDAKEVFKYLKGEEEKHITAFKEMRDAIQRYESEAVFPEEYFAYMHSIASQYVFTQANKGAEMAAKAGSDAAAIDMGIAFEKDSILFYDGMRTLMHIDDKALVDKLIEQEKLHLTKLTNLKSMVVGHGKRV